MSLASDRFEEEGGSVAEDVVKHVKVLENWDVKPTKIESISERGRELDGLS